MLDILDRLAGWWLDWRADQRIKNDPELADFTKISIDKLDPSTGELVFNGEFIAHFADEAATFLDKNKAENCVQFDMAPRVDRGLRPVRVTVAWANGEAPASMVVRLKHQVHVLMKIIGQIVDQVEGSYHSIEDCEAEGRTDCDLCAAIKNFRQWSADANRS